MMSDSNAVPAEAKAGPLPQARSSPPFRILLADDDPHIRRLSTEVLSNSGYEVHATEDGAAAWNALQLDEYDLIITDNSMPNVTGAELLEKIHAAGLKLPVIMATGSIPDASTRFPELRPTVLLLKPFTAEEMVRTVKKVLREAGGSAAASPDVKP
jgi:CheY-like chemotaxis protein